MWPSNVLFAQASEDGKTILIGGTGNNTLTFLGYSLRASVIPGEKGLRSFAIDAPDAGQEALLAVVVRANDLVPSHGKHASLPPEPGFLIRVSRGGDGTEPPHVDLKQSFVPRQGRLLQIIEHPRYGVPQLRVNVGEKTFVTPTNYKEDDEVNLVDGNTLCKFAIGDIEADKVHAEAIREAEEADLRKLVPTLQDEIRELKKQLSDEFTNNTSEQAKIMDKFEGMVCQHDSLLKQYVRLREVADRLCDAVEQTFWCRWVSRATRTALAEYNAAVAKMTLGGNGHQ